jgi:hypothetical protein
MSSSIHLYSIVAMMFCRHHTSVHSFNPLQVAKVQLWKQWNKLKELSTTDMSKEELNNRRLVLKLMEKYFNFVKVDAKKEEDTDEEDNEYNILLCNLF